MQTLGDLEKSFELYGVCVPCQRMERLPLNSLIEQLGADANVAVVRSRLRCGHCGERRADLRIVYGGACGRAARFEYRR